MIKEILNEKMIVKHLENGLDLILIPKKGAIKKYAIYATHFGSINNKFIVPGTSDIIEVPDGVAHFLEHKLFEEEDGINALDKLSKLGANANAYTSFNHTAYLFEGTENFEECLDVLISFVQNPYLTNENVEKEKGIIGQEIKMYDDDPEWQLFFNFLNCLYKNHALTKDIAGTVESISEITPETLYNCYNTFYDPSNMVICIVGDFDVEKISKFVEQRVRNTKEKGEIKRFLGNFSAELNQKTIERKMDVSIPMFLMGFRDDETQVAIKSGYSVDNKKLVDKHVALEIAFEMILGKSTDFYEKLYNDGLVKKEFGTDYTFEENYAYSSISGESNNVEQVIEKIKNQIAKVKENGLDESEFNRIKKMLYGEYVLLFNDVTRIASIVTSDYFKGVNSFDYVDSYKNIKKEYVEEVIKNHFDENKMAVSIIKPL